MKQIEKHYNDSLIALTSNDDSLLKIFQISDPTVMNELYLIELGYFVLFYLIIKNHAFMKQDYAERLLTGIY